MAAGLSLAPDQVRTFAAYLDQAVRTAGPAEAPQLDIDAEVSARGVGRDLADSVAGAGPFGPGNPEPIFAARDVRVTGVREVGTGHLKAALTDEYGGRFDAIAFRASDMGLDAVLKPDARVHLAMRVKPGRGRYVDVEIEDAAAVPH